MGWVLLLQLIRSLALIDLLYYYFYIFFFPLLCLEVSGCNISLKCCVCPACQVEGRWLLWGNVTLRDRGVEGNFQGLLDEGWYLRRRAAKSD